MEQLGAKFNLPEPVVADDPHKGRFGGKERTNGRELTAVVEPSVVGAFFQKVTLTVSAIPGAPTLSGKVIFFLHDSFEPDVYEVSVEEGAARLVIRAWGAFTVGAIADDGATLLELDMAESANVRAPEKWKRG